MAPRRISQDWLLRLAPLIAAGCYSLIVAVLFALGFAALQAGAYRLGGAYYLAFGLGWLGLFILPALLLLQVAILTAWAVRRRVAIARR